MLFFAPIDCYWKLTLMQKSKRHSRRRVSTVPLTNHMTWSEGSNSFDWISRDSINTFILVISLVGIQESQIDISGGSSQSEPTSGPRGDSRDPVNPRDLDPADSMSISSYDTGIGSLGEYGGSGVKSDSSKSSTLAEVYLGSSVPENKCITQWQAMLLQPRQVITRWQEMF